MNVAPLSGAALPAAGSVSRTGATSTASDVARAARDFEALLVAQVLKSALPPESLGVSDGDAGDHAVQFALEEFGKVIASQGGMGLSRMVVQGLKDPRAVESSAVPLPSSLPES